MAKDILIGGAWPYANYYMHIGHIAGLLPGDVLAKYFRLNGDNVLYVSGSDCHGTPITQRAALEETTPEKIAEFYHAEFIKTFTRLGFEYDKYIPTMDERHLKFVQECVLTWMENGYVTKETVYQDYCPNCKKVLVDREILGVCPKCNGSSKGDQCDDCGATFDTSEVLDKHCAECNTKTILQKEEELVFQLTAFKDELQKLIDDRKDYWRKNAVGEAQKYHDGLRDRVITRTLEWGVTVPIEGMEDKRIYVWIEAVLGYLSAGMIAAREKGIDFDKFMKKDNPNLLTYYVHGKDNIPFHATIYPAEILALKNNYRLPDYMVSSAYVNLNDAKMSKSKGNFITANKLLEAFDSDSIRFYFTFKGPEGSDVNCSVEDMVDTHNTYLVNQIGNFVNRNLGFIEKQFSGLIKEGKVDEKIILLTQEIYQKMRELMMSGELKKTTQLFIDYIQEANKYYDVNEPWKSAKMDLEKFYDVTYTCCYMMANLANFIYPFMPKTSQKIKNILNLDQFKFEEIRLKGDIKIKDLDILFQRLRLEDVLEKLEN